MNYFLEQKDILEIIKNNDLQELKNYFYNYLGEVNSDDINDHDEGNDLLINAIRINASLDITKYIIDELYTNLDYIIGINDYMLGEILYNCYSPLSVALSVGNSELCDYLIKRGADINYINKMFQLDDELLYNPDALNILSTKNFILDKELLSNPGIDEYWLKDYLKPKNYSNDLIISFLYCNQNGTEIPKKDFENLIDTIHIRRLNKLYKDEIELFLEQNTYKEGFYKTLKFLFDYDAKTEDEKYLFIYKELRKVGFFYTDKFNEILRYIRRTILTKDKFDKNFINLLEKLSIIDKKEEDIIKLINNNNLLELKKYIEENNIKFTTIQNEYKGLGLDCTNILNYVAANINKPVYDYLIDAGANPNQCNILNVISSEIGSKNEKETFIKYLIEKGSKINYKEDDKTALSVAITTGQDDIAKYLIQHGASVNDAPINYLIQQGNTSMVKLLVENGYNLNSKHNNPLGAATVYGNWEMVKYLIDNGADINKAHWEDSDDYENKKEPYDFAPLLYFILFNKELFNDMSDSLENIKYLVEHGADVNQPNNSYYKDYDLYRTPLSAALDFGSFEIVKYLVEHGADVDKSNSFYRIPLIIIIDNYHNHKDTIKKLKFLIKYGANVNLLNEYDTVLTYTIKKNKQNVLETVKCLVENGADINLKALKGDTPLNEAMKINNPKLVNYLKNWNKHLNKNYIY